MPAERPFAYAGQANHSSENSNSKLRTAFIPIANRYQIEWPLVTGENTLEVRTRNLFGVEGPVATATVVYRP